MATIKFLIQSKKNPSKIYVRLREGRTIDLKAVTKYLVNPNDWNTTKGKVKHTKDENLRLIDEKLKKIESDLLRDYNKTIGEGEIIDSNWLKSFLNPNESQEDKIPNTLVGYFEYYKKIKKSQLTKSSLGKLSVIVNFIRKIETKTSKTVLLKDVNEDFMNQLVDFGKDNNYKQNYISKIFSSIKTICYDAEINGISINPNLRRLKIKEEKTENIITLTEDEMKLIYSLDLKDKESLDNARDWLMLCCETAQRVGDLIRYDLKKIRYEKNKKGEKIPLLEFQQEKTSTLMAIPLSKKAQEILLKRDWQFPRKISAQKLNKYIKEVALLAGLNEMTYGGLQSSSNRVVMGIYPKWQLVTTRIGRRTFATNNYGKIPTPLIMTMTGHKTEKEFLKYINKNETSRALQLSEYL